MKSSKVSKVIRGVAAIVFCVAVSLNLFDLISKETMYHIIVFFAVFSIIAIELDLYREEANPE